MQLGLGLRLTHVQQAGGGGGGETLESIDFAGNTEITEYVNTTVTEVTGNVDFSDCTNLAALILSNLESIGGANGLGCGGCVLLVDPDLSNLKLVVNGDLNFIGCTALTAPDLSSLERVGFNLYFRDCPSLVNFSLPASLVEIGPTEGIVVDFNNCALNQASVDAILVKLASMDGTGGTELFDNNTVDLSGGTNAVPSATGLTAIATLESGRGNTVTVNS